MEYIHLPQKSRYKEPLYPINETEICYLCKAECWASTLSKTLLELNPNSTAICYDCTKKLNEGQK